MEYSDDAFHTFLDRVIYLAVNGTVLIQNILDCVPKTNKAFKGLERHGVTEKWNKKIILGWSNTLNY